MIRFELPRKNQTKSTVMIVISYRGKRYRYSTREQVVVKNWSSTQQRLRISSKNIDDNIINDSLLLWERAGEETIRYFTNINIIPSNEQFAEKLNEFRYPKEASVVEKEKKAQYFVQYAKLFYERHKTTKKPSRLQRYKTVINLLEEYERVHDERLTFADINLKFYTSFKDYCYNTKGYSTNYFGSLISVIKLIYAQARDVDNLHSRRDTSVNGFISPEEDVENVYLSEEELKMIDELDITRELLIENGYNNEETLDKQINAYKKARDLFLIGAGTGLRVSDYSRIKPENIRDGILTIKNRKTGVVTSVPLHRLVKNVIARGFDFSTTMSEQKINKYIKIVAKCAKLNEKIIIHRNVGGKSMELIKEKYELISSHTARRSFATNAYLAGIPPMSIMKITGHKSMNTFMKYVKISVIENAQILRNHTYFSE